MGKLSAITHEFFSGSIKKQGSSLFASICYVNRNDDGHANSSQLLTSAIEDYVRTHTKLHDSILKNHKCQKIEDYYKLLKSNKLCGGEIELQAAANICRLVIHVISIKQTIENKYDVRILKYGEDVKPFEKCVYILYDEENKHYDPLYVINQEDPNEIMTMFSWNNPIIIQLRDKFIQKEFDDSVGLQSGEDEQSTSSSLPDETAHVSDLIRLNAIKNTPIKRKLPDRDGLSLAKTVDDNVSLRILNNHGKSDVFINEESDTQAKIAKLDADCMVTSKDDDFNAISVEEFLQKDFLACSDLMEQSNENVPDTSNDVYQGPRMEFEYPPKQRYLGRTKGEFGSKNEREHDDKLSKKRPSRYFPDNAGHRSITLLVPNVYLTEDPSRTRFTIYIVTREIDGYTYFHPYFVFEGQPTDPSEEDVLPIYHFLANNAKLKDHLDNLRKEMKLRLCVVMRKINELKKVKQPLQVFLSPTGSSDKPPITTVYTSQRKFKNAYQLDDLRFAVTIWHKKSDGEEFHRCIHMDYISEISTIYTRHAERKEKNKVK